MGKIHIFLLLTINSVSLYSQLKFERITIMPSFHEDIIIEHKLKKSELIIYLENKNSDTLKIPLNSKLSTKLIDWENNIKEDIIADLKYRDSLTNTNGIPPPPYWELDGILINLEPKPETKDKREFIRNNGKLKELLLLMRPHTIESKIITKAIENCNIYIE